MELISELRRLGIPSEGSSPIVKEVGDNSDSGVRRLRIELEAEPGVQIGASLYLPDSSGRKPALLLLKDKASAALAEMAARQRIVVLEIEPRDSPTGYDNRPFLGNWQTNSRADGIGRNLAAMRAHDVLRGVDLLSSREDVDPASIRAAARDVKGIWLLLAAAADTRIGKIWLDRTPYSLGAAMEGPLNTNLFDAMIPGFLLHWDLEDLVHAMGTRRVLWTDPANWMGQIVVPGPGFDYRYSGQTDEAFLAELFR
jgi:hypothetical protein